MVYVWKAYVFAESPRGIVGNLCNQRQRQMLGSMFEIVYELSRGLSKVYTYIDRYKSRPIRLVWELCPQQRLSVARLKLTEVCVSVSAKSGIAYRPGSWPLGVPLMEKARADTGYRKQIRHLFRNVNRPTTRIINSAVYSGSARPKSV